MITPRTLLLGIALLFVATHPAAAREIIINAVGDIMLAGSGSPTFKRLGYDYPFAAVAAELKNGDITVGNLEAPIARSGVKYRDKRFCFRADPRCATALKRAGFSVVSLANNHMMDFGAAALQETLLTLSGNGILYSGAAQSLPEARRQALVTVAGARVAFLSYSLTLPEQFYATADRPGTAPGIPGYFRVDIAQAKKTADYVVVSFHWGAEGTVAPKPYQRATARAAIEAGADVILGHHPHVLQGIERYKKGIILYSLGNFVFGSLSRSSSRSAIARIVLADGVTRVELLPLNVNNHEVRFQPRLLAGKQGELVIRHLNRISQGMGTRIIRKGERYLLEFAPGSTTIARTTDVH